MKNILFLISIGIIIIIGTVISATSGFVQETPKDQDRIRVAGTFFPVYDLVRQVGKDHVDISLVVPPGTSPHAFDVSPQTIKELQGTSVVFAIGHGVDQWVAQIPEGVAGSRMVLLDPGISLREPHEEEESSGHDEEAHGEHAVGIDPHYWLDPDNAKIMVRTIADELSRLDPVNSEQYRKNAEEYRMLLDQKNAEWMAALQPYTKRDIITFHDAFYYFADHFGLNVVGTFEPFAGKEPTPKYLQDLLMQIKKHNVKVLFIEPQFSHESLETFAKDVGATIEVLDEMGGADGKESYIDLMTANVKAVERALNKNQ